MPELSLTQWLDPLFDYFARESGIPTEDLSTKAGAEAFGIAIEGVSDMLLTPLATKILGLAIGIPCGVVAIYGKGLVPSKRIREELFVLGNHMTGRVIDPKPSDIIELRMNADKLAAGLKLGDVGNIQDAFLRPVEELKAMFAALTVPRYALPPAPPTPPTTVIPTIPTAPAPTRTIYA